MLDRSVEHIAIVGCGKMGEAILSGLMSKSENRLIECDTARVPSFASDAFIAVSPTAQRRSFLEERYGVSCVEATSLLPKCQLVFLCVKPQVMPSVLEELAALPWINQALVVSIAAGVGTHTIEAALPEDVGVVRAMPNLGITIGHGVVALCGGTCVSASDLQFVEALFASLGTSIVVDECHMDTVTALSGSGPAYAAALVEAMKQAGVEAGLDASCAELLCSATLEGTGALLLKTGIDATTLRQNVSSPGGTTLAALDAMEQEGYSASIRAGVRAAIKRSKELSK